MAQTAQASETKQLDALPPTSVTAHEVLVDIEHVEVQDDPRKWSKTRKNLILFAISAAAMITGLGGNLYNPAISEIESELHATSGEISWSLSLFILFQGCVPLIWSAVSEIYGRKRGTIMGIYYCAPLLGPSLGPIIGGVLTQAFDWRATFWFLTIFTGICLFSFLLFKDTFRRERSLTYQLAAARLRKRALAHSTGPSQISTLAEHTDFGIGKDNEKHAAIERESSPDVGDDLAPEIVQSHSDVEAQHSPKEPEIHHVHNVNLTLRDVNPIQPMVFVLRRLNNVATLASSGIFFALQYSIAYTCARTLSDNYHYNALRIGLVLLSFGVGNLMGSILGGKWSDHVQQKLVAKNDGVRYPEMRLQSTTAAMFILPPSVLAYAWICDQHVHVSAICVALFFAGFSSIWIYSATLAYIVDANVGRSSSAVACNSCFRGTFAFVAAEVAVPLQNSIRDGGLYTLWAGLSIIAELFILLVLWKGKSWRQKEENRESGAPQ
ncbi:hypothetical protein EIP91_007476 [Steccherinum ochraceum]|uniref:Major facilitator superfamily (MFS) profile domain-containing protein n=1 Tax=Steccherinum ochraceum TaxID=92696 RepID=A0A4R0R494_9APHY|nr:hypothetical protein EIP91_007476 [Steccherinum ochraceum]